MHITLADIEGMASPGWEGCGSDLEVLDLEEGFTEVFENEDYSELDLSDTAPSVRGEPEPEPEPEAEKPIRYVDGCREGSTTFEICERLKNERMTGKNRLEQEFLAILQTYPKNGADLKILMWLASGFSYQQAAYHLKRSEKTIRNAARRLRQFRDHGSVKLLPPDKVQTGAELHEPFPPVRSGRPRKAAPVQAPAVPTPEITTTKITTAEITTAEIFDLFGNPVQPRKRRARKVGASTGARRVRVRPTVPGQISFFDMAA